MIPRVAAATVDVLRKVPLLAGLSERELRSMSRRFRELSVKAGDAVVTEGKGGAGFFVIAGGAAEVQTGGLVVTTLGPGDHFGEISLIDAGPRSATVVAASDLTLLGLSSWEFKPFVEEHPNVAWKLLQALVGRLREAERPS